VRQAHTERRLRVLEEIGRDLEVQVRAGAEVASLIGVPDLFRRAAGHRCSSPAPTR
jgi:hypothetical protein